MGAATTQNNNYIAIHRIGAISILRNKRRRENVAGQRKRPIRLLDFDPPLSIVEMESRMR